MTRTVVLLTPIEEFETLAAMARDADPLAVIRRAADADQLRELVSGFAIDDRLIAFATPVIVPPDVIDALPSPAYNFHNGPPAYPGLFPACFAIYDGARTFGATAHEMVAAVDQGPIIGVEECDIPPSIDRVHLEALSRDLLTRLLGRMLPLILATDARPPHLDMTWGARVTRKADFDALCDLPENVGRDEFALRLRAVGEGPYHALRVPLHGRWFRLAPSENAGPVVKGGKLVED